MNLYPPVTFDGKLQKFLIRKALSSSPTFPFKIFKLAVATTKPPTEAFALLTVGLGVHDRWPRNFQTVSREELRFVMNSSLHLSSHKVYLPI